MLAEVGVATTPWNTIDGLSGLRIEAGIILFWTPIFSFLLKS